MQSRIKKGTQVNMQGHTQLGKLKTGKKGELLNDPLINRGKEM